jgi:hypothetical protein
MTDVAGNEIDNLSPTDRNYMFNTFTNGGYYNYDVPKEDGLGVLVLNSNYFAVIDPWFKDIHPQVKIAN